jgi:hypothetical protein
MKYRDAQIVVMRTTLLGLVISPVVGFRLQWVIAQKMDIRIDATNTENIQWMPLSKNYKRSAITV